MYQNRSIKQGKGFMFCAEDEEVVWLWVDGYGQAGRGDDREKGERREAEVSVIRLLVSNCSNMLRAFALHEQLV